jgi:Holliday junction DNA helicase RuvA
MIGKLKGIIDEVEKDHLIIDVGGVGYIVFCSSRTLGNLPQIGEAYSLIIEMHVREDQITLYGFARTSERDWFRELITVKGLGPKIALAILGTIEAGNISRAILAKDKTVFTQVSGVGPKLAERILIELKDKNISPAYKVPENVAAKRDVSPQEDALSALINLGYSRMEAYNVTAKIIAEHDALSTGELIRLSLKELVR